MKVVIPGGSGQVGQLLRRAHEERGHTVVVVFVATADGEPVGADDAAEARIFKAEELPEPLAFDHRQILEDYFGKRY